MASMRETLGQGDSIRNCFQNFSPVIKEQHLSNVEAQLSLIKILTTQRPQRHLSNQSVSHPKNKNNRSLVRSLPLLRYHQSIPNLGIKVHKPNFMRTLPTMLRIRSALKMKYLEMKLKSSSLRRANKLKR
jgi:hypothetical protein